MAGKKKEKEGEIKREESRPIELDIGAKELSIGSNAHSFEPGYQASRRYRPIMCSLEGEKKQAPFFQLARQKRAESTAFLSSFRKSACSSDTSF